VAESIFSDKSLKAIWYGERRPALCLRALSVVFKTVVRLRRDLYANGLLASAHLRVPVIVVGNITVGGTGKTPLVIALVEALRARGFNPGVISRGYAGTGKALLILDEHSDPLAVGDEAALVFQTTRAPFIVCRDRVQAGRVMLEKTAVDVIICDDGLQHYRLHRDVEICVIDGARRFGNGYLLPAGPLREPMARLDSIALRVCNGGEPQPNEVPMRLLGDEAVAVADPQRRRPLGEFTGQRVHAVAGIGNPERFFAQLRAAGLDVIAHAFDDHFPYAEKDLDFADGLPVLMTAKDAVKCAAYSRLHLWSVPVRAELPQSFLDAVAERVRHAHAAAG
jgi:tetraacyldisaccharide 4'-kinase